MAKFELQLPDQIIKDFETINKKADKIFGEMTKAGAEVVLKNVKNTAPSVVAGHAKLTKTYKTPSDGGINTKVTITGYIPFSNPNRMYFQRKGANGLDYYTDKGVPADFLANILEYGRSNAPFPKHPFLRKSFKKKEIEEAMLRAQREASDGLLDEQVEGQMNFSDFGW